MARSGCVVSETDETVKAERGAPSPFGVSAQNGVFNFAVYAEGVTYVNLCLSDTSGKLIAKIPLQCENNVWYAAISGGVAEYLYYYEIERDGKLLQLSDPFARNLNTLHLWRKGKLWPAPAAGIAEPRFDWGEDKAPQVALGDMVIYEAHVKGLTMLFPDLPDGVRGKYRGVGHSAVIDHLKHLGVTTLELLPVFSKTEDPFLIAKGLHNYWGYNTLNYFSPESEYAAEDAVTEFKTMVRELHRAGIEVVLDVVYNHTGEGGQDVLPVSFRGLAEKAYYVTDAAGRYIDYSHCGNSLNTEHALVRQMIVDSLRYWVGEMHVDGFRFDLAPAIFRKHGAVTFDHEIHHMITNDPLLKNTKLIVEPWDLGPDGYQSGRFPQPYLEWNDVFRDAARQFWKGESSNNDLGKLMINRGRPVINFITCHDGFTLRDLVSYEHKHNEANGEGNKDGAGHNHSFNCGIEGETADAAIMALRKKMRKNLLATLIFSQDIPMLLAGDEMGNSQHGNNNAYCQDSEISWLKWNETEEDMINFVRQCLFLRIALLATIHPHTIAAQNTHSMAFGIEFDRHFLLLNASRENVLFSLHGVKIREVLHTQRDCRDDEMQDIYYLPAQSVALLQRVT